LINKFTQNQLNQINEKKKSRLKENRNSIIINKTHPKTEKISPKIHRNQEKHHLKNIEPLPHT
jgi:hypothetical protein